MKKIALILFAFALCWKAEAQISITGNSLTYTQDFNSLDTTTTASLNLPAGWSLFEYGTSTAADQKYKANTGSSATGETYSYGSAGTTDRALGSLVSGTISSQYGAKFVNNTGVAINGFTLTYRGEEWRFGQSGRLNADSLRFLYSTSAAGVSDTAIAAGFVANTALMFTSPNITASATGALSGNVAGNFSTKTATVGVSIPAGGTLVIKWVDVNITGTDDGLAIDDVSIVFTASGTPTPSYRPEVAALIPANHSTNIAAGTNLQITFDRQVIGRPAGDIYIKNVTDQTTLIKAGNATDVTINGSQVTIANAGIAFGKSYYVTFDSLAFDTASYHSFGLYDTSMWAFTTAPAPALMPSVAPVAPLDNASNIPANATATLSMAFSRKVTKGSAGNVIIKNETDQSLQSIPVVSADVILNAVGDTAFVRNVNLVAGKSYHVLVDSVAFDTAGYKITGIADTTRWNFKVGVPVLTVTTLNEQFSNTCPAGLPAGWLQYSVAGSQTWKCNGTTTNYGLVMTGRTSATASTANEDWLITPQLDLTASTNPTLAFKGKYRYEGPDMDVKYSTDYTGFGDPNLATWTDLQGIAFTTVDSNKWVTKTVPLTAAKMFLAFKYTSLQSSAISDACEWSVDSVVIANVASGITSVKSQGNLGIQVLSPATNGNVVIALMLEANAPIKAEIYDLAGRRVYQSSFQGMKGNNKIRLQPQSLQSGLYIIRISDGKDYGITRALIQ